MIFIPMFLPYSREPDRCPHCNKIEDGKFVCKHCGYEYPETEDDYKWLAWIGLITLIGAVLGAVFLTEKMTIGSVGFVDYIFSFFIGGVSTTIIIFLLLGIKWIFQTLLKKEE